jgi:hypothetical protein
MSDSDEDTFQIKITQLRLERNYGEASDCCKPDWLTSLLIPITRPMNRPVSAQRLAGDTAAARIAKQACNILEEL